jgi:tetratricopeptide (TPR) repeat protein
MKLHDPAANCSQVSPWFPWLTKQFFLLFHGFSLFFVLALSGPVFAQNRPDALLEYRNGNFERAAAICKLEIETSPNSLDSYVVLCWSLIRLGRHQEALVHARTARNLSRYDARVIEILGEINYYEGHNSEALQFFQEYVNMAPGGQRIDMVYFFIGEIYIRLGRFRHADIALSTAVHWTPENASWWTRLAYARESAGDFIEAITAYERALALNSQMADARRGLERARQALTSR